MASMNVTELIDQHKFSKFQFQAVSLCFLIMIIDGFDAQSMSFAAPAIAVGWHVARPAFGPVFAAGLLGLALGGLLFGSLADRYGRKSVMVFCAFYVGVFTLCKVLAGSMQALLILHFISGLGVGGIFPNSIALSAEYTPRSDRATMVAFTMCGYSVGSGFGGFFAAYLLSVFGWKSLFVLGGLVPLVIAIVLIAALPESPSLMVVHKRPTAEVARVMKKIIPSLSVGNDTSFVVTETKHKGISVGHLFRDGRAFRTVLLWVAVWMDLMIVYFMISWLPMLTHQHGFSLEKAVLAGSMFSVAGIFGALIVGRFMDWFGVRRMLALSFGVAALFIVIIGTVGNSYALLMAMIFCAGFFVVGGHAGINAFASYLYPTHIRSTGVGWALGVGRIGSLISPVLGGLLIGWHWKLSSIFLAVAVPACIAAITIFFIGEHTAIASKDLVVAARPAEAVEV